MSYLFVYGEYVFSCEFARTCDQVILCSLQDIKSNIRIFYGHFLVSHLWIKRSCKSEKINLISQTALLDFVITYICTRLYFFISMLLSNLSWEIPVFYFILEFMWPKLIYLIVIVVQCSKTDSSFLPDVSKHSANQI